MDSYSEKQLFGGAITSNLPTDWKDLSDVRPVPNHQECFFHDSSMLVIEILERQEHVEDDDAAAFFFNDLEERNNDAHKSNKSNTKDGRVRFRKALESPSAEALLSDDSIVAGTNKVRLCAGCGYQSVYKGTTIRVDLCLLRLPFQETDLLVTLSAPVVDDKNDDDDEELLSLEISTEESVVLDRVIETLRIREWGLFG